jgi:hypothetical protein
MRTRVASQRVGGLARAAAVAALLGAPARASADDGPAIELAPEHQPGGPDAGAPAIAIGAGPASDDALARGMTAQRLRRAAEATTSTAIGGYGEIAIRGTTRGREGEREWVGDVARLVVFVAHSFSDSIRGYTELEVEHAQACSTCGGAVELEQAYVEASLAGDALGLRAGLVLMPMGIVNQWHEPPVYHGAIRPRVDTVVIPSTWRELAAGFYGSPVEPLRYEVYAATGFDPTGFSAAGIAGGRQNGSLAKAAAWSVVGRVEVEPLLGMVLGASGYAGDTGPNLDVYDRHGERADLRVPVLGFAADARFRRGGLEWKLVFAEWDLPESGALMGAYDESGARLFPDATKPVPTRIRGAYLEGAYDVLRPLGLTHQLLPFARIEHYDTQSAVPGGYEANPSYFVREYTFGLTYRPIPPIVVKADYQLRNRKLGYDETQLSFGAGFMY